MRHFVLPFLSILALPGFATPAQHTVVAPHCLLQKSQAQYQVLTESNDMALIQTDEAGISALARSKKPGKVLCGGFTDVTDAWQKRSKTLSSSHFLNEQLKPQALLAPVNYRIQYPDQVAQLLKQINPQDMWDKLTKLTQFKDRYANSSLGVDAANLFKNEIEKLASQYGRQDVKVYTIATPRYQQPSVVAVVGNPNVPGIVIGAHMDTLQASWSNKPGADDDGSGSVVVLEAARTVIASGMHFKKPIYFIWYAAEEEGLVGSHAVVAEFKKKQIPIDAVMHFDMTGFDYKNEDTLWLMDDYVNKDLVSYLSELIGTYVKKPVKHSRCGYACSDHASWTQGGYPAAIPAEASYEHTNPSMHSAHDTQDNLSIKHMTDYLKLATAFAVEMAEPV